MVAPPRNQLYLLIHTIAVPHPRGGAFALGEAQDGGEFALQIDDQLAAFRRKHNVVDQPAQDLSSFFAGAGAFSPV